MTADQRRVLGTLARLWAATMLGCCSLAVWVFHIGGPVPVWSRVITAATIGIGLAIVAEVLTPFD